MFAEYPTEIPRWGVFEVSLKGPSSGNPFTEQKLTGTFTGKAESVSTEGFYDGEGIYRIRFMPSFEGTYSFCLKSTFSDSEVTGTFSVLPPENNNHGPVRVVNTHHFAYEDGTPYISIGTTPYAADIIDTWNMTIKTAGIFRGSFSVDLPARQYMAVRLRRVEE
ncbi:MAG: DUF5060 domain-containing protein [Solobacterium sp.]|nr:DUF5060 domain-containing protein [Solobacterium sp.]